MNLKKIYRKTIIYAVSPDTEKINFKYIDKLFSSGIDFYQLRLKNTSINKKYRIALRLKKYSKKHNIRLIINDNIDIALAVDADGVHIGKEDLPVSVARRILKKKIIGRTVRNLEQAGNAIEQGADYISLGPIFHTLTKQMKVKPRGIKMISKVKKNINKPLIVIGGIDTANIKQVLSAEPDGVAFVRAVDNIRKAKQIIKLIRER